MTADITFLEPIAKNRDITDDECNTLLDAEEKLLSPDNAVFEKYCADVSAIVEKLPPAQHIFIAKWFAPIVYKLSVVNKAAYKRAPKTIGRMLGLDRVWRFHYQNPVMRESVVIQVWNDPDEAIDDKKLIREYYRDILKLDDSEVVTGYDKNGNPTHSELAIKRLKMDALKALEASHESGRKKAPQALHVHGDMKGDVVSGDVTKMIIKNPEMIPNFMDKGVKEKIRAARRIIEDKKSEAKGHKVVYVEDIEAEYEDVDE